MIGWAVLALTMAIGWAAVTVAASINDDDIETTHWTDVEHVDSRSINVYPVAYHSPSCWRPEPEVHYRANEVGVVLRFRRTSDFCTTELGIHWSVIVRLEQDLGGRQVVDDAG